MTATGKSSPGWKAPLRTQNLSPNQMADTPPPPRTAFPLEAVLPPSGTFGRKKHLPLKAAHSDRTVLTLTELILRICQVV